MKNTVMEQSWASGGQIDRWRFNTADHATANKANVENYNGSAWTDKRFGGQILGITRR